MKRYDFIEKSDGDDVRLFHHKDRTFYLILILYLYAKIIWFQAKIVYIKSGSYAKLWSLTYTFKMWTSWIETGIFPVEIPGLNMGTNYWVQNGPNSNASLRSNYPVSLPTFFAFRTTHVIFRSMNLLILDRIIWMIL